MASSTDIPQQAIAPGTPRRLLGILFAEDFDEPGSIDGPSASKSAEPSAQLTTDVVERACSAAVQSARAEWERDAKQRHSELLASIGHALADARAEASRIADAAAEGLASTLLAMLAGAMPRLCRDYGPAEVRAIIQRLVPALHAEPRITIRVHHEMVAVVERDVANLKADLAGIVSVLAAPIEPGDVKVTWENGSFTRDGGKIVSAMQDALGLLGLHEPIEVLSERSMALAE